jgi:hypothetical protein
MLHLTLLEKHGQGKLQINRITEIIKMGSKSMKLRQKKIIEGINKGL